MGKINVLGLILSCYGVTFISDTISKDLMFWKMIPLSMLTVVLVMITLTETGVSGAALNVKLSSIYPIACVSMLMSSIVVVRYQ
jgi:hypothetical protein